LFFKFRFNSNGKKQDLTPICPLPRCLGEKGVNGITAGGMGARTQQLFAERGIAVSVGTPDG